MFTKRRGNDLGNIIAMIIGFIVVAILSGLPHKLPPCSAVVVHSAELAAGNGIPLVDLRRHHRHVFRGDFVLEPAANITHRVRLSDDGPQGRGYRLLKVQAEI